MLEPQKIQGIVRPSKGKKVKTTESTEWTVYRLQNLRVSIDLYVLDKIDVFRIDEPLIWSVILCVFHRTFL